MFRLRIDPSRKLLEVTPAGTFWDMDVATRLREECAAAVASLNCVPGTHLVLVDQRDSVLQTREVFDCLLEMVRVSVAARMALVADAPIARMQTRRFQIRDTVRMFDTMEQAEAWLFDAAAERRVA